MLFQNVAPNTLSETELAKLKPITECQEKFMFRIIDEKLNGLSLTLLPETWLASMEKDLYTVNSGNNKASCDSVLKGTSETIFKNMASKCL